jgi:hypothetical protein
MTIHERLRGRAAILDCIERQRAEGRLGLGSAVEEAILRSELRDLAVCTAIDEIDQRVRQLCLPSGT